MAEAAERRMRENEAKGIKNIESVKRQQLKRDQLNNMQTASQDGNLKVISILFMPSVSYIISFLINIFSGKWDESNKAN